jgi:hypothetical protein
MLSKFLIFTVVILLFSSGAIANIGQVEKFSINALQLVGRCGPIGSARGGKIVLIGHSQKMHEPCFKTTARQQEKAMLVQYGAAKGVGGVSGLIQCAKVKGRQGQNIDPFGPTVQKQRLNVNLGQLALKVGGVGSTEAVKGFVGGQSQTMNTPRMSSSQSQFVGVGLYSAVSGSEGSNGIVVNSVDVKMGQRQIVDPARAFPRWRK